MEEFEDYLLPTELQTIGRAPKVFVQDDDWFDVCKGLISMGVCGVLPRRLLHRVGDQVLLNGFFAVSKQEGIQCIWGGATSTYHELGSPESVVPFNAR